MSLLLILLTLWAPALQAQVTGDCRLVESRCSIKFMPAPTAPSPDSKKLVVGALAKVKTAELAERAASDKLNTRAHEVAAELAESIPWYNPRKVVPDHEIEAAKASDPTYLRLMAEHQSAVTLNYNAHNAAIAEVLKAYQLVPPITDFAGDPRAAEVNMVAKPWFPHYSEQEKRDERTGRWRKRTDEELKDERLKNSAVGGGVAAALTRGDGAIQIWGQAFASPEELAITIFHETSHWLDRAAISGGYTDRVPPEVSFRSEQHAYERAASFARHLGVDPTHHDALAKRFELQADISERFHLTKEQIKANPKKYGNWLGTDWKGQLAIAPAEQELSLADESLLQKQIAAAQKEAAAQRRKQEEIAHREHDERLKITLADLARRACEYPGSVSQSDLDELPLPYSENLAATAAPAAAASCSHVYLYLAGNGRDARTVSTMVSPPNLGAPIPQDVPSDSGTQVISFEQMLPRVRDFAMSACRSPGQARLDDGLKRPQEGILFLPSDDDSARRLETGLGECERLLFRRMIGVIRFGNPRAITDQWIADRVREYSPPAPITPPVNSPPVYSPPSQPRCEEFGNKRCP